MKRQTPKNLNVEALEDRLETTARMFGDLWDKSYKNTHAKNPVSTTEFNDNKRALNQYRDETARLLAAISEEHPDYIDLKEWDNGDGSLGEAISATSYPERTREWLLARVETIGGSDFGKIVKYRFEGSSINGVEKSKTTIPDYIKEMPSMFDVENGINENNDGEDEEKDLPSGPLFRGSTWEDKIVVSFREDYAGKYDVAVTKDQYINNKYSWMKINVDGVITDVDVYSENYGKHGILEIKNVSEYNLDMLETIKKSRDPETGFADNKYLKPEYLAQMQYYLKGTGFQYAVARKQFNDTEPIDFYVSAADDVYLGSGIKTEQFIEETVEPLHHKWREQRQREGVDPNNV